MKQLSLFFIQKRGKWIITLPVPRSTLPCRTYSLFSTFGEQITLNIQKCLRFIKFPSHVFDRHEIHIHDIGRFYLTNLHYFPVPIFTKKSTIEVPDIFSSQSSKAQSVVFNLQFLIFIFLFDFPNIELSNLQLSIFQNSSFPFSRWSTFQIY